MVDRRLSQLSCSRELIILGCAWLAMGGCGGGGSSAPSPADAGTGGATTATGGAGGGGITQGTGGRNAGTGGAITVATGGTPGTGGAPGTGGLSATGGAPGTGGQSAASGGAGGRGAAGGTAASTGGATAATGGAGGGAPTGGAVCTRWKADRVDRAEGTWTGNLASCTPGDITGVGRANTLRQVNLFRWLAGLPAVTEDATKDQNAQACALLQDANKMLSHMPPASWTCYMAAGAMAAGQSNIATTAGVRAVDLYMTDRGNETTIGHRRWILSNSLGPLGMGSTSGYSCLMTLGGSGNAGKAFAAWPPPGEVPLQALNLEGTVDAVGWSIQSDTINLANAQVTVSDAGAARPVTTFQLPPNYGSRYAIRIVPMGWAVAAGHTYAVAVTGTAITYSTTIVSCP